MNFDTPDKMHNGVAPKQEMGIKIYRIIVVILQEPVNHSQT